LLRGNKHRPSWITLAITTAPKPNLSPHERLRELTAILASAESTRKAAFTYDALGRRIEHVNDVLGSTTRYYYDGVNEIVETDGGGDVLRYYVHGLSYVDERLMMMDYKDTAESDDDRPYYFTLDRMYNVRFLVDRAGALVERYVYDAYGRPHIRESCGRGDMNNETTLTSTDDTRFTAAKNATIWDPRADMDDDGDIDANDQTAFDNKVTEWPPPTFGAPTVAQAFSEVGNPFMFQGRPHFALDTAADATEGEFMLNDHRARMNDPATGRWITRDPLFYNRRALILTSLDSRVVVTASTNEAFELALFSLPVSNPNSMLDPSGLRMVPTLAQCTFGPNAPPGGTLTGLSEIDDCYADCVEAHEQQHLSDMSGPCFEAQRWFAHCDLFSNPGACRAAVVWEWNQWFGNPCVEADFECRANEVSVGCLQGCMAGEPCCAGVCENQLVNVRMPEWINQCATAANCNMPDPPSYPIRDNCPPGTVACGFHCLDPMLCGSFP